MDVPREIRKIIFDKQDMLEAMLNYAIRNDYELPRARVDGFAISQDPEGRFSLKFKFDDPTITMNITLNQDEIGAAMILYCKNQRIPLPRNANKSLVRHEDSLALQIALKRSKIA